MYRLAHVGDLHLAHEDELSEAVALVEHAVGRGADHVAFSGDVVNSGEVDLVEQLLVHLRAVVPGRVTIAPGNHDVYPLAWPPSFSAIWRTCRRDAQKNYERLLRVTVPAQHRRSSAASIAYGRRIDDDVVLAAVDTTRSGTRNPAAWAAGELSDQSLAAVRRLFRRHASARHRIVVMHHYPFDDFSPVSSFVPMKFVMPPAREVRRLLAEAGTTLVLCGHIHANRIRPSTTGFSVVTTDSTPRFHTRARTYTLLELGRGGTVAIERVLVRP